VLSRSGRQQQGLGRVNRSSSEGDFLRKGAGASNEGNQEGLSKIAKTRSYATPKVGLPGNPFGPALYNDLVWAGAVSFHFQDAHLPRPDGCRGGAMRIRSTGLKGNPGVGRTERHIHPMSSLARPRCKSNTPLCGHSDAPLHDAGLPERHCSCQSGKICASQHSGQACAGIVGFRCVCRNTKSLSGKAHRNKQSISHLPRA
jgi:hypothetical protein